MPSTYICIDLKSFYASVECVARGLDPLKARLLVADGSRTDKTICLAVSPALKAIGVPARPRLFEARQKIREHDDRTGSRTDYITARPRMAEYIRVSQEIYEIYCRYVSREDIHVYSIDECFLDVTAYLHLYRKEAAEQRLTPAYYMAQCIVQDVVLTTGITATVGIGTNLYLAKVGMDIVAKKCAPDSHGMRAAFLNEELYRRLLWTHRPLTDFWRVGPGTCRRLQDRGMYTMGDVAAMSLYHEDYLYRLFGIDAELLIDHAWGLESTRMEDIKGYHSSSHSLSRGQVLARPYAFDEARLIFHEMTDLLAADLVRKHLTAGGLSFYVSYDPKSLEVCDYEGPVSIDFYGRLHPRHAGGAVRLRTRTCSAAEIIPAFLKAFDARVHPGLLVRRLNVSANDIRENDGYIQLDLFTDYAARKREDRLQHALLYIRHRYGPNAVLKGINLLPGGTARERNRQIGGHRA
ncbi:MAG: DNA methylase [Oscillospiraceae bacterium]|nr:DNA methylase [Oscillospiraceae bacterium]